MLLGVYFDRYNTATLPEGVALGVLVRSASNYADAHVSSLLRCGTCTAASYSVLAACRPPLGLFLRQQRLVGMGHAPGYR